VTIATGSCGLQRSATTLRKNPPRITADGLLIEAIHLGQNTMADRTGQADFGLFSHGWAEQPLARTRCRSAFPCAR
jgi:hypothetical protein